MGESGPQDSYRKAFDRVCIDTDCTKLNEMIVRDETKWLNLRVVEE